jgi:galactose mutarotase-like enzyme
MPAKTWKLLDHADNTLVPDLTIGPDDVDSGGKAKGNWQVELRTLHGGLSEGVQEIRVNNGKLTVSILPTRGMGIWKAWLGDLEIGWKSPNRGPVHPMFVPSGEWSGLGWLDGFDELLARCGLESNGAPEFDEKTGRVKYALHGRIANKPAQFLSVSADPEKEEIVVKGIVEETRFHFLKLRMTTTVTLKLNEAGFSLRDEVENFSSTAAEMQMLYHVNFGLPLLDGGSRLVAPIKTIVPRNEHAASGIKTWDSYSAPEPGYEEMVYFSELNAADDGKTRVLLKNAHGTRGASLLFNKRQLPCFSLWKDTAGEPDGYVTGLEPGTNFPNPRSYEGEQGRVVKLKPGERAAFDLSLEVHASAKEVEKAEQAVEKIQGDREAKVYEKPQQGWCA